MYVYKQKKQGSKSQAKTIPITRYFIKPLATLLSGDNPFSFIDIISIIRPTKTTAALSYHRVRGLYFQAFFTATKI